MTTARGQPVAEVKGLTLAERAVWTQLRMMGYRPHRNTPNRNSMRPSSPGKPDFTVVVGKRTVHVEVKRGEDIFTPRQTRWLEDLQGDSGYVLAVVTMRDITMRQKQARVHFFLLGADPGEP